MRRTAGYSVLDNRRNEDISENKVDQFEKKLAQYKQKCLTKRMK
jgi:hypothetical protein